MGSKPGPKRRDLEALGQPKTFKFQFRGPEAWKDTLIDVVRVQRQQGDERINLSYMLSTIFERGLREWLADQAMEMLRRHAPVDYVAEKTRLDLRYVEALARFVGHPAPTRAQAGHNTPASDEEDEEAPTQVLPPTDRQQAVEDILGAMQD